MYKIPTRKFIAMTTTLAWLVLTVLMIIIAVWFPAADADLLRYVWGGFTGFTGLVIGFYFGKSTALEGVEDGVSVEEKVTEGFNRKEG